jgi:hypothetical protein
MHGQVKSTIKHLIYNKTTPYNFTSKKFHMEDPGVETGTTVKGLISFSYNKDDGKG